MRNLKKILALVLALVMSFSIMTVSSADFKDQDKLSETYAEAVDVLSALNVFKGDENGNFNPEKTITRAEVATIIYRITTGDVNDEHYELYAGMNLFTDVTDEWFAGYVNYCAATGYIKGYDGKFNPNAEVNGVQALAMILRAIGYDKNGEFSGTGWDARVKTYAAKAKVLGNLSKVNLGADATREVVAQILFNAINVPQVTYSILTNDYITYSGLLTDASVQPNASLAQQNFGLMCISGQIVAVGRLANTTTIAVPTVDQYNRLTTTNWTIKNTNTSWELIGHDAHIWAVNTYTKPNVASALTEAYVDSTTIYTSHDHYDLLTKVLYNMVKLDTDTYELVYNNAGKLVSYSFDTELWFNGEKVTTVAEREAVLAKIGHRGVKVDFICNDNGGRADVIVVTEYTPAVLTNIATNINHGTNGIYKGTYTFDHTLTDYTDYFVYDGELEKGQLYTYVEYAGDYYVSDVQVVVDVFNKLNRSVVDSVTKTKDTSYVVGEETYVKAYEATRYFAEYPDVLEQKNLRKPVMLVLDQYGYILYSNFYSDPAQYLYIFENEETHKKLTEAVAVLLDGTVLDITIAALDDAVVYFDDSSDYTDDEDAALAGNVYQYYVEDGVYYLYSTNAFKTINVAEYYAGESQFGTDHGVNKNTTLVDVRPYGYWYGAEVGDVYAGHRSETRIPTMEAVEVMALVGANNYVVAGFLTEGYNFSISDKTNDFIVFNTAANHVVKVNSTTYKYYLDVIKDGVLVEDYEMSQYYYDLIDTYGVGHYQFDRYGNFTFTTFEEAWKNVIWGAQSLKVGNQYFAYDELPFYVLNIGRGTADSYEMVVGEDLQGVKAYLTYDVYGDVDGIYVIADTWNLADATCSYAELDNYNRVTKETELCAYYVADYAITVKAKAGVEKDLANAIADYDNAREDYNDAIDALNAWVEKNSAAKATKTLADLIADVKTAEAALNAAFEALAVAYEACVVAKYEFSEEMMFIIEDAVAEYSEALNEGMMAVVDANEYVDEVAADVEFKLNIKTVNAVYTVGEDTTVEAVVVAAVEKAANEKAAANAALAELIALGAVVKAEIVEAGEFVDGANEIVVRLVLDLNGELKAIEKTITVNLSIEE